MNLNSSSFDISVLKGALLTNPNGAEFRIVSFSFHANEPTKIYVNVRQHDMETGELLEGTSGLCWASLSDWDLQIQGGEN
tara:strand:- start:918 stop:1157 length:240 start_codon:yes stop_codon:yes gene_type:complete